MHETLTTIPTTDTERSAMEDLTDRVLKVVEVELIKGVQDGEGTLGLYARGYEIYEEEES